jgi:hypothetical protein
VCGIRSENKDQLIQDYISTYFYIHLSVAAAVPEPTTDRVANHPKASTEVDEAALAVGNIKGSEIRGVDGISHGAQLGQYIDAERVALAARAEVGAVCPDRRGLIAADATAEALSRG